MTLPISAPVNPGRLFLHASKNELSAYQPTKLAAIAAMNFKWQKSQLTLHFETNTRSLPALIETRPAPQVLKCEHTFLKMLLAPQDVPPLMNRHAKLLHFRTGQFEDLVERLKFVSVLLAVAADLAEVRLDVEVGGQGQVVAGRRVDVVYAAHAELRRLKLVPILCLSDKAHWQQIQLWRGS